MHLPAAPSSRRGSTSAEEVDPEPEVGVRPRLPVYRIRANETLRSIANRTLGDSHRADEILELNRAVINDPHQSDHGTGDQAPRRTPAWGVGHGESRSRTRRHLRG